jgi:uncharacterized protein YecE (DUF72 family)
MESSIARPQRSLLGDGVMTPGATSCSRGKRRSSRWMPDDSARSSSCSQGGVNTVLNSATRVGMREKFSDYCPTKTSHSAFPITTMRPTPWERTADFVYLRGHGPGGRYEGRYSRATLAAWSKSILMWRRSQCDVYVYFDNDQKSAAPMDALALLRLLGS